jgi:2-hydroxychromene-2-carboxylate isomerase
MTTIRFHFDFLSPYAYLAWTQIHGVAEAEGASVEPMPILFAALLNHHGQKGPAEIPSKRTYVFKDATRRAALLGVPFGLPPSHPFRPLLALRAATIAPAEHRRALIDGLFAETWGGSGDGVEDPAVVRRVAERAGLDGAALLAQAESHEAKDALRAATEEAIAAGVFGVPTMRVGSELFWGLDSLDLVRLHLRGEDPLTPEVLAKVRDVPATAKRQ